MVDIYGIVSVLRIIFYTHTHTHHYFSKTFVHTSLNWNAMGKWSVFIWHLRHMRDENLSVCIAKQTVKNCVQSVLDV
jgi:hypothetical protein